TIERGRYKRASVTPNRSRRRRAGYARRVRPIPASPVPDRRRSPPKASESVPIISTARFSCMMPVSRGVTREKLIPPSCRLISVIAPGRLSFRSRPPPSAALPPEPEAGCEQHGRSEAEQRPRDAHAEPAEASEVQPDRFEQHRLARSVEVARVRIESVDRRLERLRVRE